MFRSGFLATKDSLADLFFPPQCAFCESAEDLDRRAYLCRECRERLLAISPPFCGQCGVPFPSATIPHQTWCGSCLAKPPAYSRARFGFRYEAGFRDALLAFKYYQGLYMSRTFAALAIEVFHSYFSVTEFDLIVPVPMSNRRLLARGFNHSALIAARLSSQTKIPVERRALRKAKETPPQARLTRVERLKNVRGSFGIKRPENIRDRRILLVDDVATTGSTIAEASRLLIKKGKAESVDCLVLGLRISAGIDSAASTGDPPESGNDHQS